MKKVLALSVILTFYSLIILYSIYAIPTVFDKSNLKGLLLVLLAGVALIIWTKISYHILTSKS
ncbi:MULTISPECIES: hypothetical protein [Thalassotalea]|uniref:hypothetical protein n=1 Tax=Thalassotalea TaxID=1518149 RepID=UPI000941FDFE|nr:MULTISPECIES: hypothetical protein [Thalassotalea]MDO6427339.1 hypothetical protein [Thalassotalea sp. 1_MG-2023]OKY27192.1 hypothetical protein BI291_09695 [Thalassotalea sp. PP2-459]